ncbi:hypothetical protein PLESTB_000498800 [Pleodorina starrii]|uniref:C2 domain-containing protein n=1 Tax=Pleodorina starrii TaxID=330485 RepID=A0A9W6BFT9_9CHLO|nr:hypothetical protein PLESTM_000370200 [Pleodorina starrii]GLC51407.1 hypothetical protein PLESTB_000498800 [Pleodorina starrii]GLC63772.1 hypothetical protein PLESTF_000072300 [Pleodorina starrii]
MGNCLHVDVESRYATGDANIAESVSSASDAEEATALLSSSLAYSTWVELSLQCSNLPHADYLSKSDPMGILYQLRDGVWVEFGRTEMIANNYNPAFVRKFRIMFNFEVVQKFRVLLVDIDKGQDHTTVHPDTCNFLGCCHFELAQVVTGRGKKLALNLTDRQGHPLPHCTATIKAEEESSCKDHFRLHAAALNLRHSEVRGKPDPFLQISRLQDDGTTWLPVYKTEARRKCVSPIWSEIHVRAAQLNNGDAHRPLRFQVYDYESNGAHKLLSYCDLSTHRLRELAAQQDASVPLLPPPGKRGGDYGSLQFRSFVKEFRPTFLDYIAGGAEIGFVVAVDFTASNGDPRQPTSKHFISGVPTQYEQAVMGLGQVIMHYDHDKEFPMLGFGGRKSGDASANHCFSMGQGPGGSCNGIGGLLQAYRRALFEWRLSGPTYFAPVIRQAARMAAENVRSGGPIKYTCLLILTDGEVSDLDATIDAIIEASTLPLSILIVGVGCESFAKMRELDSDKRLLANGSRTAVRDIVQFVEFNRFAGNGAQLAAELLAELPGQMVDYCLRNKVLPPRPTSRSSMPDAPVVAAA